MKTKNKVSKNQKIKQKKEKSNEGKKVFIIPIIFSVLIIAFFTISLPLEPQEKHTSSTNINFRWAGFANKAFVDDNPEFTSPLVVLKGSYLELKPGTYYWKPALISSVKKFTIDSTVSVEVKEENIKNSGNVNLLIRFFKNFAITGQAVLDIGEDIKLNSSDVQIVASQYGG